MSTEHQPHHSQAVIIPYRSLERPGNVVPLQAAGHVTAADAAADQDGELLAALSPLLDEVDGLRGSDAPLHDVGNVGRLLEENKRLRKLAIKLSNLLGDLPKQSA
ncbi:MAG: hypothetical protein ABW175_03425 [Bradyrhizobium sp.]|jgi:hypothetical protein